MHCPKAGSVVFLGLVLMTAGFVLTLAGWFAPPIREAVLRVRLAGPISLLVGLFLLAVSCCVCAVQQRKCCICCNPETVEEAQGRYDHTQLSPLLLREMRLAMDKVGASSTATSSAAPSAECSSSSLPQQEENYLRGSIGSLGGTIRNHHSPRKKRRGNMSPNSSSDGHRDRRASSGSSGTNRHGRSTPRPASVFLPRAALYNETYFIHGQRSPTTTDLYQKQVKVVLPPYTVGTDNCTSPKTSPSPSSHRAPALTPTIYLRTYAEDIVSAL